MGVPGTWLSPVLCRWLQTVSVMLGAAFGDFNET